ncbi:hypothetical protein [Pseudoduganella lutea]|uniref:Uncharacterized protein n=1 Tax=Pseudoduganella lutea TaxID=321985 RepID=A0A4V0Z453_9BURK|nr:hypothetical protein [Pseudoduganella lutea]QBE65743.1 hypothetical protein EWM63_24455 [Pseudoduganella lutea]
MTIDIFRKIQVWLKAHGEIVALLGLVTGTAIAIGIPIWQTYWLDTPQLAVEIYAIDRSVASDVQLPLEDEELKILAVRQNRFLSQELLFQSLSPAQNNRSNSTVSYSKAADLALSALKQERKSLPEKIEERNEAIKELENLTAANTTSTVLNRFSARINQHMELGPLDTVEGRTSAIASLIEEARAANEAAAKRNVELESKLPAAEQKLEQAKKDFEAQKSTFQISAVFTNAGRKSISIRQSALCRVYIGRGNYVDIRLSLKDAKENAEIAPNGTRIASFSSEPLESFLPEDRQSISTHWGQSVHAILFVEDISGAIHSSNRIAFAKGAYQKSIFDRLTAEASKQFYQARD